MTTVVDDVVGRSVAPGKEVLLSMRDLRAGFETDDGRVQAVDGVSFDVARGEVFAIVGESGSGKSVTAMSILGLQPTLDVTEGEILWKGRDLLTLPEDERRRVRGNEIAMIFQDPLTALNPVHTVGRQIGEMARIHEGIGKKQALERSVELLDLVGIPEPRKRAQMYPHEYSGGMRQRAMIAMAITCNPDLLIADEPTTALDVTVQAQVLEVLVDILPRLDDVGDEPLLPIAGSPPSLIRKPSGCVFHPRCRFARVPGMCDGEVPALRLVAGDAHMSACHYAEELAEVTIESLRASVDVTADAELFDAGVVVARAKGEDEDVAAQATDVIVEEGIAHPGVTERSLEGERPDTWPEPTGPETGREREGQW